MYESVVLILDIWKWTEKTYGMKFGDKNQQKKYNNDIKWVETRAHTHTKNDSRNAKYRDELCISMGIISYI